MIPISVRFAAFGPYVEEQVVDFTHFLSSGLMLIYGETGSGKTVLLDAITFALYGQSSGGSRGDFVSMRCLAAPPSVKTFVEFVFEVRKKRYKFVRDLRIRKKHSGAIEYLPEQNVLFLDDKGVWIPFFENPKKKDLEQKAQELIGLSREQFCQVMILPQGKFERLLVAKSEEKEAVLVTLFHAQHWQKIADRLCARANEMRQKLDACKTEIKAVLEGFGCTELEQLEALEKEATEQLAAKTKECSELEKTLERERKLLEDETKLFELFQSRETMQKTLAEYEKRADEMAQKAKTAERAKKAAAMMPYQKQTEAFKTVCEQRTNARKAGESALKTAQEVQSRTQENWKMICLQEPKQEDKKTQLARLTMLLDSYHRLDSAKQENDQAQALWQKAETAAKKQQELLLNQTELCDALQKERTYIFETYSTKLPTLQSQMEQMEHSKALLQKQQTSELALQKLEQQCASLNQMAERLQTVLEEAKQTRDELQNRWLKNAANALAQQLEDGQPCPVCGSVHHTAAQTQTGGQVTQTDLERAVAAVEKAQQEVTACWQKKAKAAAECTVLQNELNELAEQAKETVPYDAKQYTDLAHAVSTAQKKDARRQQLSQQFQQAQQQMETVKKQAESLEEKRKQCSAQKERTAARYQMLVDQRDAEIPDSAVLNARIQTLKKEISAFESQKKMAQERAQAAALTAESAKTALKHLTEEECTAFEQYQEQKTVRDELLHNYGFATVEELKQVSFSAAQLEALERELSDFSAQKTAVSEQLSTLNEQLSGKELPDVAKRQAQIEQLQEKKTQADAQRGALSQEAARRKKCVGKLGKKTQKLEKQGLIYDRLSGFGKLLRGDNGVSLRRYVLGIMLSSVTAQANLLLRNVHGGRYQLYRCAQGTGRTRKVGLDLEVLDGNSGKRRSVTSLSGGEKFLVSLSLALGLSAVVQAQSGGIRMDAMFIDEGFGTLDPQSINDALEVLSSVKGSRRLVGIISHVQALRESIPSSIEVVKNRSGSRLKFHM